MSIQITSGRLLQSLSNNNNGRTSYYTGIFSQKRTIENESVKDSLSINDDFRKALRRLKNVNLDSGLKADVEKYAKQIIKSYNEYMENDGNQSKRYASKRSELKDIFSDYSKELSKIGITMEESGKLKFDSDKFEEAKMTDIKTVFAADSDFMERTDKVLRGMNRMVKDEVDKTVHEDIFISNTVASQNIWFANQANGLAVSSERLLSLVKEGGTLDYAQECLNDYLSRLSQFHSDLDDERVASGDYTSKAIDDLIRITELNADFVNYWNDSDTIELDEWFGEGTYGDEVNRLYKDFFQEMVGTAKKDFEISSFVDFQA